MIDLPYPHKALWPNGRPHWAAKHTQTKKHRQWGYIAAQGVKAPVERPIPITLHVHAKPKGPLPDKDNCVAAAKSLLDGIADAIGVNDQDFDAPKVVFSPNRDGRFVVEIAGV